MKNIFWFLIDKVGVVRLALSGVAVAAVTTVANLFGAHIPWLFAVVPLAATVAFFGYVVVSFVKASQNR